MYSIENKKLSSGLLYKMDDTRKTVAPITGIRYFTIEHKVNEDFLGFVDWNPVNKTVNNIRTLMSNSTRAMYHNPETKKLTLYPTNATQSQVEKGYVKIAPEEMPAVNGFFKDDIIILFSPKTVYKFSAAVTTTGYFVDLEQISMQRFFICKEQHIYTEPPTTDKSVTSKKGVFCHSLERS